MGEGELFGCLLLPPLRFSGGFSLFARGVLVGKEEEFAGDNSEDGAGWHFGWDGLCDHAH